MSWHKIGQVGVDTGTLWLGDPAFLKDVDVEGLYGQIHESRVDGETRFAWGLDFPRGRAGLGVAVKTGLGDGTYDVFARIEDVPGGWGKRVAFIPDVDHSDTKRALEREKGQQ